MELVYVERIIDYHHLMTQVLVLVYHGDHQVFRQREHYMLRRMVVIRIVDYLKGMLNLQLVQLLQSHKREIQSRLDQEYIQKIIPLD